LILTDDEQDARKGLLEEIRRNDFGIEVNKEVNLFEEL